MDLRELMEVLESLEFGYVVTSMCMYVTVVKILLLLFFIYSGY